ncbi:unnamed protein product, partial [Nesidiocoris tenuis]
MSQLKEDGCNKISTSSRNLYPPAALAVLASPHAAHLNKIEEHKMAIAQVRENLKNDLYVPNDLT